MNGLKQLTDKQAQMFGRFNGHFLFLNGLDSLSAAQAKALSLFKPGEIKNLTQKDPGGKAWASIGILSLNGLTSLTDEVAKALGNSYTTTLELNSVDSLTLNQAKRLANYGGNSLELWALKALGAAQAAALAVCTAKIIFYAIDDSSLVRFAKDGGNYWVPAYREGPLKRELNK